MTLDNRSTRCRLRLPALLVTAVLLAGPDDIAEAQTTGIVEVEEALTTYADAGNGAGPMWCYGSTCIARQGDDVYASVIETGQGVPLLCNTRWQLWHRSAQGWKLARHEEQYRQREPCPIGVHQRGALFLSVNPSTEPPGVKYGPCHPLVLEFNPADLHADPRVNEPAWADDTYFTDHSYRGFAADGVTGELLLLNIHARNSQQFVSWRDRDGRWHARGTITFPIRSCYPQVALRGGAAHVLAIGDIVEPVAEWRNLKREHTKVDWDYVFRRLFYTMTPAIADQPFIEPVEVDTVEETGGHIRNLDLFVDAEGAAHLLYTKQPHQHAFLRDKYFPEQPMTTSLEYRLVRGGKVALSRTLAETLPDGSGLSPACARFHVDGGERLHVIVAGTMTSKEKSSSFRNYLAPLTGTTGLLRLATLDLEYPFNNFFTNTPRGGSAPGEIIDLLGTTGERNTIRYARIRLPEAKAVRPGSND